MVPDVVAVVNVDVSEVRVAVVVPDVEVNLWVVVSVVVEVCNSWLVVV